MAAVASATAGTKISSPSSSNDHPPPSFMQSLSLPASFFSALPPPATFFATLLAHHQSVLQPIPVPPPVVPAQHNTNVLPTPVQPPQTPTTNNNNHNLSSSQQQSTPRSISPVPPGIYCDLGPAVFERTSRGYTVLRFEGYSFSKISDNRTKTYWRCANRTCRAKVHTNGGRIVYIGREPHVHKPRVSAAQQNNANNNIQKVRAIKPSPASNIFQQLGSSPMSLMSSFVGNQQAFVSPNNNSTLLEGASAPLDLRPKKEPSSVVIFDDDDKDLHSSSDGGAKYEESAAAKSSSSVEDDELEIEGDDEAEIISTPIVASQSNLDNCLPIRTPPSSPSSSTTSTSLPSSPSKQPHFHLTAKSSNSNDKMMTSTSIRQLPRSNSEVELYRLLQRANLLGYYDTFLSHGGDDVQQLVEANEEEFAEILRLVDMASKPLHVRRLQKVLAEWCANPVSFRAPLTAAEMTSFATTKAVFSGTSPPMSGGIIAPPSASKSSTTGSSISTVSPRHLAAGDAALSLMMMSTAAVATKTPCESNVINSGAPMNLSIVSHSAYPTASSSSSSGSPSVFFSQNNPNKAPVLPIIIRSIEDHSTTDTTTSPGDFPENSDSEASSFCSTNISEPNAVDNNGGGLLMLKTPKPIATLSNDVRNQIIQAATGTIAKYPDLLTLSPRTDFTNARMKASEVQQLLGILDMPRDQAAYLEGVQRFSMIFGRFDTKRKHPEKNLTFHELAVNEASAALCLLIPALLTHRERLYHLARQAVREIGQHGQSVSPLPTLMEQQRSTFATPPPPVSLQQKTPLENQPNLKRKQDDSLTKKTSITKQPRRSVITESGEIVFPSLPLETSVEGEDTSTSDSNKNNIAMELAKQFGFPDLVDELQKDQDEEDSVKPEEVTANSGDDDNGDEK